MCSRPAALRQQAEHRRTGRLLGHRRAGDPQHGDVADGRRVDVVGHQLHVGRSRLAVEQQLGVLGRRQRGERQRRAQHVIGAHEAGVDAELGELGPHVAAERVVADLGDDGGVVAESSRGHGDVGGRATDRLDEPLRAAEAGARLVGVQVDADPPDRQDVELGHAVIPGPVISRNSSGRTTDSISWASASSSAPPAISCVSSSRVISLLAKSPRLWPRLRIRNRSPTG